MKRILMLAAIAMVAAVPAISSADTAGKSTVARGGQDLDIKFILRSIDGKPAQIKDFKFKKFTVSCAIGGPVDASGEIAKMNVNDKGKFDGVAKKGDAKVKVEGQVKQHGQKVVGTLKASGNFGAAEDCDSTVNWEAQ
jgi:hypothetical protein